MKLFLKVVGVILGILLLVAIGAGGFMYSQMPKPTEKRIQVTPDIVGVLQKFSYVWILRTPHGVTLIDAGPEAKPTAVLDELAAEKLQATDVHAILLTHGHADHWTGVKAFPNAVVYVGPGDAALVRGERHVMPAPLEKLMAPPRELVPEMTEMKGDGTLVLDGQAIKVISIPGHTQGSVAYLFADVLFTGDSLMQQKDGSLGLGPKFFSEDADQNKQSLHRLLALDFKRTADGHHGLTEDATAKLQAFLQ
jgi:glyoxylase-like metal-dependent hydrolase (beta-lactamase superfamily II)